jgi:hypothetical protein
MMPKPDKPDKPDGGKPWHADQTKLRGTQGDDTFIITPEEYGEDITNNFSIRTYDATTGDFVDISQVLGLQNSVTTGDGADTVIDSAYYDWITTGPGPDVVYSTSGYDTIQTQGGDDVINVDLYKALNMPDLPYDPGGPFETKIMGGGDYDKVVFHMTPDLIGGGYKDAISNAFEAWRNSGATSDLDLRGVTSSLAKPVEIILFNDIENLEIINQSTGEQVYIYQPEGANNPIDV